jgi:hypothetical protein
MMPPKFFYHRILTTKKSIIKIHMIFGINNARYFTSKTKLIEK